MIAEGTRRALRPGLVGGAVAVFACVVGMVERFHERELIGEAVPMSYLMLALIPIVIAYVATRPRVVRGEVERVSRETALIAGASTGVLAGLVLSAFLLLVDAVNVRTIFVAVSPGLIDILSFEQATGVGAVILVVGLGVLGAAGGGLNLLAGPDRRALVTGAAVTLFAALLEPLLRVMLFELGTPTGWLYRRGGLTVLGAVVLFAAATAAAFVWARKRESARGRFEALDPDAQRNARRVGLALLLVALLALPQLAGSVNSQVLGTVGFYVVMGLGLNIVVGFAGLLDLGYVAFFAVGAYTTAILTSPASFLTSELSFWVAVPIVILIAAITGVLIGAPVLRLRGDYLAIVTLGFGEIARVLVLSDALEPWFGGAQGIIRVPDPEIGALALNDPQTLYYLILAFCLVAAFVSYRLAGSRVGRAWNAMREDEQVAEAMGISTIKYKLLAFATGAALGCLSGALFAVKIGSIFPHSFEILVSITVLALIILGGMGSIPGVIVGAIVLVGLPEWLREFAEFRLLIYGAVLVAIMILRPQGLIPNVQRSRELQEEERAQDQWARQAAETPEPVPATGGSPEG